MPKRKPKALPKPPPATEEQMKLLLARHLKEMLWKDAVEGGTLEIPWTRDLAKDTINALGGPDEAKAWMKKVEKEKSK